VSEVSLPLIDRRTSLAWVATAMAATLGYGCSPSNAPEGERARPVSGVGYGTDPNLVDPIVTWSLTMSAGQRHAVAVLADVILPPDAGRPKPSAVGIVDFVDEWVSAPYPVQAADRVELFKFVEWLDREAIALDGKSFSAAAPDAVEKLLNRVAFAGRVAAQDREAGIAFARARWLLVSGTFTSPQGVEELQFVGSDPLAGDYPGPTVEALAHLDTVLDGLGLSRVKA